MRYNYLIQTRASIAHRRNKMAAKKKIEDMGIKYEGARKDQFVKSTVSTTNLPKLTRLTSLWTIPNWVELALKSDEDKVRSMVFYILYSKLNKTAYFNKKNFAYMTEEDAASVIALANDRYTRAVEVIVNLFENHVFASNDVETAYGEINKSLVEHFLSQDDITVFSKAYGYSFRFQNHDRNLIKRLELVGFGRTAKFDIDRLFSFCEGTYGRKKIYLITFGLSNKAYKCPDNGYIYTDRDEDGLAEIQRKVVELNTAQYQNNCVFKNKDFHKRALPCASDIRIGKDHLMGAELTPEKFMHDLKFKGVEFGNWVTDKERNDFLVATYNALADLMEILGLPLHYASLNGRIGIAFGSRGKSTASAHYEPSHQLISITKTKAIGNLAHEYFHALDHLIAENAGAGKFASKNQDKLIFSQEPVHTTLISTLTKVKSGDCMRTSKSFDATRTKVYFSLDEEMMARTFEQWVEHTLQCNGQSNPFLVFDTIPHQDVEFSIYPLNNEMLEIAPLMQQFADTLCNYLD